MKTALFTNFTTQEFIGYWDGKAKRFPAGSSLYMPDYLAKHFAKHLTNRELLKTDVNGNFIYKDGDKMTSPKFPEQVPMFIDLFNKAYTPEAEDPEVLGDKKDDVDALINSINQNKQEEKVEQSIGNNKKLKGFKKQDATQPQVVLPADFNDDED